MSNHDAPQGCLGTLAFLWGVTVLIVGVLIAGTSGFCALNYLISGGGQLRELMADIWVYCLIAVPIGLALCWYAFRVLAR
jgi:hypothetical protein